MVRDIRADVRRWLPLGRFLAWLRGLCRRWGEPTLRLPSTYDEVIYDAKTDTYYGLIYPKEMREANAGKPIVVHVVGDDAAAPNGAAGAAGERAPAESTSSPAGE